MSIYEFEQLSIDERANLLWHEGMLIDGCKRRRKSYVLYFVHSFYVEIEVHDSKIAAVVPFSSGHRLDKYLDKLPLAWLL